MQSFQWERCWSDVIVVNWDLGKKDKNTVRDRETEEVSDINFDRRYQRAKRHRDKMDATPFPPHGPLPHRYFHLKMSSPESETTNSKPPHRHNQSKSQTKAHPIFTFIFMRRQWAVSSGKLPSQFRWISLSLSLSSSLAFSPFHQHSIGTLFSTAAH